MRKLKRLWRRFCNEQISHRTARITHDGFFILSKFDPLIQWFIGYGTVEIGTRHHFSIGFMYGYRIGKWSRIKTKFVKRGRWTFFIHLGECEPYNPLTGRQW